MLEGLVAWVLNNYLGKYVENLNTDQLSVALPSGKVELENLPLKKDALRHLGLPVEVKAGYIGKVQLHVPVRQIRSAPWLISIEKMYVVAAPVNLDEWDAETEAQLQHERKVSLLDALEAVWRAEHEASDAGYYATSYSSWLSYGTGLLANIVENLQLKLNDVHIRYEDALTCESAFACGLTVEALTAESCDREWRRGFTPLGADGDCSFKLLELQKLAVYWDPVTVPHGLLANYTRQELTVRMSQTWLSAHRYLVSPSSAEARVSRERTEQPLRSRTRPRVKCNLTLDKVLLNLTSRQYNEAVCCLRGLERIGRLREFRALRPAAPVATAAREWWLYALRCHCVHHHWMDPAPTWESCLARARQVKEYVEICLSTLNNPTATLAPDKKAFKDEFEWNTPLHLLKPLREIAMRKVPKSTPVCTPDKPSSSGRSMLVHWFPQWWGWYGDAQQTDAHNDAQVPRPPELEEEILDVLADSLENNTLLKRDSVFGQFEFLLNKGSLTLSMINDAADSETGAGAGAPALELQFSQVSLGLESRPRTGSHALHVSLGGICLRDKLTPRTLYPVLVAQGQIREGLSAMNVTSNVMSWCRTAASPPPPGAATPQAPGQPPPPANVEPLFQLSYEKKPFGMNCDYKLYVKCQSLEVVYNLEAARWVQQLLTSPLPARPLADPAHPAHPASRYVRHTRQHLISQWQHMMHGDAGDRRSWNVELDISAPQIFFVEDLCEKEAAVLVVDFGRMRLANAHPLPAEPQAAAAPPAGDDELDDEERFMTPCSTPPGSLLSPASPPDFGPPAPSAHAIDAANLHRRLYDRYNIEFSDLQILVGRARDNWKFTHTKSTSSLHLLDRFSISLQAERRVVHTSDPQYPTATLCGTLPALVVHLSEQKLASVSAILAQCTPRALDTSKEDKSQEKSEVQDETLSECSESDHTEHSTHNNSRLFMLQFAIDQMSLEVQSRGRSIAEVQVCGVRLASTARPQDLSLSLSVHSLLLVDALQTYGPDFELLVASHKHVGMDVVSGSILGSEPTSPTAPTSPPPPHALQQALHELHHHTYTKQTGSRATSPAPAWTSSPPYSAGPARGAGGNSAGGGWGPTGTGWGTGWSQTPGGWGGGGSGWGAAGMVDAEALIAIELCFVKGDSASEDLRIANILFNNLDIIANQETIVELIGFTQRVLGTKSSKKQEPATSEPAAGACLLAMGGAGEDLVRETRTEITFDFHRLGVLLLRAAVEDGTVVAKKIATATLSEAKIQATVDADSVSVGGSLGGVQVVSLCGGATHTRVVSVGRSPARAPCDLYRDLPPNDDKALLFRITRNLTLKEDAVPEVQASVDVHVASVWYTHSVPLLVELRSCVTEFKQYLANLARSIRAAAADMAIGLVQPRESLYSTPKLSQSTEGVSPRRRTTSMGCSIDEAIDTLKTERIVLSVTVELETPVVVVPRRADSTQVFVAHLGRMSLANRPHEPNQAYRVRVRDISLASLDIAEKLKVHNLTTETMHLIYDVSSGKPVLHNTALQLSVDYNDDPGCEVTGKIVGGLRVTSTRDQYEQLLDTLRWLGEVAPPSDVVDGAHGGGGGGGGVQSVVDPAVPTLRLDPAVRAQVLAVHLPHHQLRRHQHPSHTALKVNFQLPNFTVELRADFGNGEKSLVDLSFREFNVNYEKLHPYETNIQMSLHSITMEDLTQDPDSKHRMLMVSHTPQLPKAVFVSKSCPDFVTEYPMEDISSVSEMQYLKWNYPSLPSELNVCDRDTGKRKRDSGCGVTPPCSPECGAREGDAGRDLSGGDNLVWISVHIRDPQHPLFEDTFDKVSKLTKVEFNCLKLVVSVDSWVAVIDFFGDEPDTGQEIEPTTKVPAPTTPTPSDHSGRSRTEMSIRSLSVLLVGSRGDGELARGQVSGLVISQVVDGRAGTRELTGRLGALALSDLTPRAPLWRDRFLTHGERALTFNYQRVSPTEAAAAGHDTSLSVEMGPVTYAHSKRFVAQLQTAARDFSRLRSVIQQARQKVSVAVELSRATRLRLRLRCQSPVIAVPVSGRSRAALVAELATLTVDNCFKLAGDPDTVSTTTTPGDGSAREVLDVRHVKLDGVSIWCGRGARGLRLRRRGAPLLPAPAQLMLQIESNMSDTHNVPDMTIQGTLTTLQITLDPEQYRLIRGVLAHNLGESVEDLLLEPPRPHHDPQPAHSQVWTTTSIKLDLQNVTVRLEPEHGVTSLACINFIKSRLLVETYCDLGQDIDLVSQEILVSDTRYSHEPANRRGNVFSNIVQPQPDRRHHVQLEVHARKRGESSAYTILINNMRLMAILDWWEAANQFIMQPPTTPDDLHGCEASPPVQHARESTWSAGSAQGGAGQVELKLNITDSQLVLVEDASLWDTNAVILKSTTVITYRGGDAHKPVSCVLNELEVFSCVLGLEEETALSIVDPCALHVDLRADRTLHFATRTLNLRLSYHDMRMFAAMMNALPAQARLALSGKSETDSSPGDAPANSVHMRSGGSGAGGAGSHFGALALRGRRDQPAWNMASTPPSSRGLNAAGPLKAIEVQADCITLCVIDDCLDSDVPLLEVSLSELHLEQDLRKVEEAFEDPILVSTPAGQGPGAVGAGAALVKRPGPAGGRLAGVLSADYYNRVLSGWEPVIEPWRFETWWEYTVSSSLSLGRLQLDVTSSEVLNTNVTSSLIELVQLVRGNWTHDYYAGQTASSEASPKGSPAGHRRRSPFVPYALRNHTGHRLWFTTLLTTCDVLTEQSTYSGPDDSWVMVRGGDTEPFSFGARGRGRGGAAGGGGAGGAGGAPARLHQLALRLDGWSPPQPVCVDRAGVFWRTLTHSKTGAEARIVFEVSLEGSARKLVTVRSALVLVNKLPHPVEVRVDHAPLTVAALRALFAEMHRAAPLLRPFRSSCPPCSSTASLLTFRPIPIFVKCGQWSGGASRTAQVSPGASWAAPLSPGAPPLWVRPLARAPYLQCARPLDWRAALPSRPVREHYQCSAPSHQHYRFCCIMVRERFPPDRGSPIAGHTLTLVPELRLENLLPLELQYRTTSPEDAGSAATMGAVPPGETRPFHEVNVEEGVELSVKLEGFGWSSPLSVGGGGAAAGGAGGGGGASFTARVKLRDARSRRLYLTARVTVNRTDGIKVCISAAYWLVNRVGLPLVFRAEGGGEAAGQGAEHELARARAPLLFAFAEADGGPTVSCRLGKSVAGTPEWCSPFGLGPGVAVKKLEVRGGAGGDRVFAVGVSVRAGRGRYRHTNIVTLTPRYQLHNNTEHTLQFAQQCTATDINDPGAISTHVTAVPGCYLPWHWPRWERPQLLCVRVCGGQGGAPRTAWSGAASVNTTRSLHLACREPGGGYVYLRVEVVAQDATLFVLVSGCESVPPPLRLENCSPVAIMFHQVGCGEECVVGAHAQLPWALPMPEGGAALCLRAPGGPRVTVPLDALNSTHALHYQNFIYVAFCATGTGKYDREPQGAAASPAKQSAAAVHDNVLVLEVPLGSTRVILGKKRYGDRSQLWRRGPNDQLIHEGSSPPQPSDVVNSDDNAALAQHAMVLDIEGPAPRPDCPAPLALRRMDPRRVSTQAWKVMPSGRMVCAHSTLAVQAVRTPGSRVVLGMARARRDGSVPDEQAVEWQTLRPGSGHLNVMLYADGPTRVLRILDQKSPEAGWVEGGDTEPPGAARREWGARVALAGVSVSLVARTPPAELLHALLAGVRGEVGIGARVAAAHIAIQDMHWDNQLLGTPSPVLLYCPPERGVPAPPPALHAAAELVLSHSRRYNAYFFRHFILSLRPIAIRLEERLILKLCLWGALPDDESATEEPDEPDYETHRMLHDLTAVHATRYYFGVIKIIPSQIRLSMMTANKLEGELAALKRRLGLTLIRFEDATVELEPFVRHHPFETAGYMARLLLKHFKDELKWQAAKILGSVDFLGAPLGFVADVSEGVSGLIYEGSVGALLKNVTHGISNSAAKVTESLGDGLERVVTDESHEETRRKIRSAQGGSHLVAGFRGLGLGLLGGMTSLVKHSYEGAQQEGLPGFLAGVGKGLVGTVTKPVIGVLDLAAETASALRDTSRRSDKWVPGRLREPRCAAGPGGLLPRYCSAQAQGAQLLYQLNGADYTEVFLAYRAVRDTPHDIRALLSTQYLRIFTCKHGAPHLVMETHLSNLVSCAAVTSEGAHYVELGVRGGGAGEAVRRPRVQCDSGELAAWVARHAAYARQLYHETVHTLHPHADL